VARLEISYEVGFWFHLGSVTLLEGFLQGFFDVTACWL
jgi:hypothetical protein